MPGTQGNRNRTTHGTRGFLALGSLPKGASYIRRLVGRLRGELETAVQNTFGEISLEQAALIQSACRHEGVALLWQRWLRQRMSQLKASTLLQITKQISCSTDLRDRSIRALKIDRQGKQDAASVLYALPIQHDDEPETDNETADFLTELFGSTQEGAG